MKKSHLALIVSAMVFLTVIVWLINTQEPLSIPDIVQYGIILVLIGFGVYVGISRLKSEHRGEPPEDELSKRILQKASSTSYYISIYMWLAVMYISDKTKCETHSLIGAGILGMAIVFCICWIIYKIRGTRDV
jgi:peptidoglycan/LPS O-acetylase OafA/YrhL